MKPPMEKGRFLPVKQPNRRMTLEAIVKGVRAMPWAILVYGTEGVGKSTLVVDLKDSITLDTEQSANRLETNKWYPLELQDVYDAIDVLLTADHDYKSVVIDTIDRLEAMVFAYIVAQARGRSNGSGIHSVEDFGYGKGYQIALDEWRKICARLDELRATRGMNVLLIGHTFIKKFTNPDGADYDRYILRLHEKAGGFIREWCDAVLFARFEESTTTIEKRVKGVMTGERVLHTQRTAAFDAKNRFNLPDTLPLSWRELETAMQPVKEGVT